MKLYAVRIRLKHEPVGIYWAQDISGLEKAIAEVTRPGICEYLEIAEPGALTWSDPEDWQLGAHDDAVHEAVEKVFYKGETVTAMFVSHPGLDNHINKVKAGMTFNGSLWDLVINNVEGKWKSCEPSVPKASLLQMWAERKATIEAFAQLKDPEDWLGDPDNNEIRRNNRCATRKLGAPPRRS